MKIHREMKNGKLWLSQHKHVDKILKRFIKNHVKAVNIPLSSDFNLSLDLCPNNDKE